MTILRVRQDGDIYNVEHGLVESIEAVTATGIPHSYINRVIEQLVLFLTNRRTEQGIVGLEISARYPEYPRGDDGVITAEVIIPTAVITCRLGPAHEVGIGRKVRKTEDGWALGFRQDVFIEFDCHGADEMVADQIAGWIGFEIQKHKASTLRAAGFIDFLQTHSSPAYGFDNSQPWDYTWRFYKLRLFRHLLYMKTSFEVVWVTKDTSLGYISNIVFNQESTYFTDISMGVSLEYLLAEEIYYGWHGILP